MNFRFSDILDLGISDEGLWTCLHMGSPHLAMEPAREHRLVALVT